MEEKQKQTEDKIEKITAEQLKVNLESDVKAYTKSLEDAKKGLENYTRQLKYSQEMWDILSEKDSIRRIEPQFNYELNEKWWELMHQKQLDKIRQDKAVSEGTLAQLKQQVVDTENALKASKEKLEKFSSSDEPKKGE